MRVKDSNTAFAIAFGAFMTVMFVGSGLGDRVQDGLTPTEIAGVTLAALAGGILTGWVSYYLNRWLRARGYGIGEDDD